MPPVLGVTKTLRKLCPCLIGESMSDRAAKRRLICRLIALLRGRAQQVTLAEIYARYCACGGNRTLDPKVLKYLGAMPVAAIERNLLLEWGRKLYPRLTRAEQIEHLVEPLAEIIDLPPAERAWWADRKRKLGPGGMTLAEVEAILGPVPPGWAGDNPNPGNDGDLYDWEAIEANARLYGERRDTWASVTKLKPAGPPPDPGPREHNYYVGGTSRQWEAWDHRGQFSKSRLKDGTQVFPGPTPKGKASVYARLPNGQSVYIGYVLGKPGRLRKAKPPKPPAKRGRPRKPNKESNAEKMRRYRKRKKEKPQSP